MRPHVVKKIGLLGVLALCAVFFIMKKSIGRADEAHARLGEPEWAAHHEQVLRSPQRQSSKVVVAGDSIIEILASDTEACRNSIGPYQPLWLGFSGDTTSNLLWRLEHGELEGVRPEAVVLLIGTNNTRKSRIGFWSTQSDADGVLKTVQIIHDKLPNTHVVVFSIMPTAQWNWKEHKDMEINQRVSSLLRGYNYATWIDISRLFQTDHRELDRTLFMDQVHPNHTGRVRLCNAIGEAISPYMNR